MSIGTCVPCKNGQHEDCNGPGSSLGCVCEDRNHQEEQEHDSAE